MADIVIRFAIRDDIDKIMKIIGYHWYDNHILAHNKDFFLYTYGGNDEQINMVIAEVQNTGEIAGILGYIKYNANDTCDLSPILWLNVSQNDGFLGLKLMLFLVKNVKHRLFFGSGIYPATLPIYRMLKYHVGHLEHYYRISNRSDYKIARILHKNVLPITDSGWNILLIPDFDVFKTKISDSLLNGMLPYKDKNYFYHRFYAHPVYHYMVFAVVKKNNETIQAFFVCREVEVFKVKILRIMDYIGEEKYFSYLAFSLQKLMDDNEYEYIDCYCHGMSEQIMNNAGLIKRKETDTNIIPNYFEPFLCENMEINYFTSIVENLRTFKGDSNQDQPRMNDRYLC